MKEIAIVIPCYNRVDTLRLLLESLLKAKYDREVELIFSIDYSGSDDVEILARAFVWEHGKKTIIKYDRNIGLRENIIGCGDMTQAHDAIIVLEDDLVVSPLFFEYATKACDYYWNEDRIAGVSLYSYRRTESKREFIPITRGYDTYFIQWTSSWGQLWTKKQWQSFRNWYDEHREDIEEFNIPAGVKKWKNSWKKYNIAYLSDTDRYYVYPVKSFTTMVPALGTHSSKVNVGSPYMVPLCNEMLNDYIFQKIDNALLYDSFFELNRIKVPLEGHSVEVDFDLYCSKQVQDFKREYYVTTKKLKYMQSVKTWGRRILPVEANVLEDYEGHGIYLYKVVDYQKVDLTSIERRELKFELKVKDLYHIVLGELLRRLHFSK